MKKRTVADFPNLLKEWHPTKNAELNPHEISFRSAKEIWWICEKGHEWQRSCDNRRCGEVGCSYCTNRKPCNDNCLATTHPEIAKEWHSTLNGKLTPNDVFAGTHKKYWWICEKGHEWKAACYSRVKRGCPYCANQKVCNDNCLTTTHPEIAKEWHSTLNGKLTPNDVFAGTHKKYWWICEKGHEWESVCYSRTSKEKVGCPYCVNRKVCNDNCLTTTYPEIAKEWHTTLNGKLTPNEIAAGTPKKFWWQCSKGHDYKTSCCLRTYKKTGCPICCESKGEKEVARILDELNISYRREFAFENCKNINKLRFDFVLNINGFPKAIEYHGIQHYEPQNFGSSKLSKLCKDKKLEDTQYRDEIKRQWCNSMGIPLLEISYKDYDKIEEQIKEFLYII